ncbi:MAG TPA: hypothetical protein VGD67_12135 [Pseudonocardiaceae bacterium]
MTSDPGVLDTTSIIAAVRSHALATGYVEDAPGHEPISRQLAGLVVAVWVQRLTPVSGASGLASTSVRLVLNVRVYAPLRMDAPDEIDPAVMVVVDRLLTAYCADFTLGGLVHHVDIFGRYGAALDAVAGYVHHDGGTPYRVMTITLPLVIHNVWEQNP